MRTFIVLGVLAASAVLAVGVAAAPTITAPPSSNTDATGDAGTAPDLTTSTITNDDHGVYTVTLSFATPYTGNVGAGIYLDTDKNANTGDPHATGAEYWISDDYGTHTFYVEKWNGSDWADSGQTTAAVTVAADQKSIVFSINKSDLGDATSFNYWVYSLEGDGSSGHFDEYPEGTATMSYAQQTVYTLSAVGALATAAKAGGTWTIQLSAVRSDTSTTVGSEGTITCSGTAGTKKLAATHAFVSAGGGTGSAAVCIFKVPKTPKHLKLKGTITITSGGQSVTQTFSSTSK